MHCDMGFYHFVPLQRDWAVFCVAVLQQVCPPTASLYDSSLFAKTFTPHPPDTRKIVHLQRLGFDIL